ncbi:hypothetical protein VPH35_097133 [Triticum aestivum]|uniref:Uncharacterized protein n=1 Tax=Aegilops tauschii subsp. strangulata TaxID=200361 RepID=A0A453KFW8_AEGTS
MEVPTEPNNRTPNKQTNRLIRFGSVRFFGFRCDSAHPDPARPRASNPTSISRPAKKRPQLWSISMAARQGQPAQHAATSHTNPGRRARSRWPKDPERPDPDRTPSPPSPNSGANRGRSTPLLHPTAAEAASPGRARSAVTTSSTLAGVTLTQPRTRLQDPSRLHSEPEPVRQGLRCYSLAKLRHSAALPAMRRHTRRNLPRCPLGVPPPREGSPPGHADPARRLRRLG